MRPCSIRVAGSPYPPLRLGGLFHVKHSFLVDSSGDASAPPDHPTPRLRAFALRGLAAERGCDDLFRLRSIRRNSFAGAGLRVRANCAHASLRSFRLPLRFIWERMFHVKHSFPLRAPRPPPSFVLPSLSASAQGSGSVRASSCACPRVVVGPPRSCPRPARRGRPRASSRSSSCAPATSPLPPIPPRVAPACPASLPPPSLFSASHLCRDPVPAAPLPPPPFLTTSTRATLRFRPLSRGLALPFRLALVPHSCPAPAFRPSNPPPPCQKLLRNNIDCSVTIRYSVPRRVEVSRRAGRGHVPGWILRRPGSRWQRMP